MKSVQTGVDPAQINMVRCGLLKHDDGMSGRSLCDVGACQKPRLRMSSKLQKLRGYAKRESGKPNDTVLEGVWPAQLHGHGPHKPTDTAQS